MEFNQINKNKGDVVNLLEKVLIRKWARLPVNFGPYWFCKNLGDRDIAEIVFVCKVEYSDATHFFRRREDRTGMRIMSDEGWWLPILDERKTAGVEDGR